MGLQTTCVCVGYVVLEYQLYVYQGSSMVATARRGGGSKPAVREAIVYSYCRQQAVELQEKAVGSTLNYKVILHWKSACVVFRYYITAHI